MKGTKNMKMLKTLIYRFSDHFHVGIHGFCREGITTKYKVFILCIKGI